MADPISIISPTKVSYRIDHDMTKLILYGSYTHYQPTSLSKKIHYCRETYILTIIFLLSCFSNVSFQASSVQLFIFFMIWFALLFSLLSYSSSKLTVSLFNKSSKKNLYFFLLFLLPSPNKFPFPSLMTYYTRKEAQSQSTNNFFLYKWTLQRNDWLNWCVKLIMEQAKRKKNKES